jgi:hypothetical protein
MKHKGRGFTSFCVEFLPARETLGGDEVLNFLLRNNSCVPLDL